MVIIMKSRLYHYNKYIKAIAFLLALSLLPLPFGPVKVSAAIVTTDIPKEYNSVGGAGLKVKNQGEDGSCWVFAAVAALEASVYHKFGEKISLSEEHARYSLTANLEGNKGAYRNENGINNLTAKAGGEVVWAMTHFLEETFGGAVPEDECPYGAFGGANTDIDSLYYSPVTGQKYSNTVRVNSYINLSVGYSSDLSKETKKDYITRVQKAIMDYGAVTADIFFALELLAADFTYNNTLEMPSNHAVCLVGWKNIGGKNYWIAKNSYGEEAYDKGYFYISFEDPNVLSECYAYDDIELEEKELHSYFKSTNQQIFYSDYLIKKGMREDSAAYYVAADANETIEEILVANGGGRKSVNIYLETDQENINKLYDKKFEVMNSPGVLIASVDLSAEAGIHRIKPQKAVTLTKGEQFAIRAEIVYLENGYSASTSVNDYLSATAFLVRTKAKSHSAGNAELLPDITLKLTAEGKYGMIYAKAEDLSGITSFQYLKGNITDPNAKTWKSAVKVTESVLVEENGDYTFRAEDTYGNIRLTTIKVIELEGKVLQAPSGKLVDKNTAIEGKAQVRGTIHVVCKDKVYSGSIGDNLTYKIKTGKLAKGTVIYVWSISDYGTVSEVRAVTVK